MQDFSLAEFLQDQSSQVGVTSDPQGRKRQEAIWELFTSECVYFLDQLMVLKEVTLSFQILTMLDANTQDQKQINQTQMKPNSCSFVFLIISLNSSL